MPELFELVKEKTHLEEIYEIITKEWKKFVQYESTHNLEYLMVMSTEATEFLYNVSFTEIHWTENYHYGELAHFAFHVIHGKNKYVLKGNWDYLLVRNSIDTKSLFPLYFTTTQEEELASKLFKKFGMLDILMLIDGDNWLPEREWEDYMDQEHEDVDIANHTGELDDNELPF